MRKVWIVIGVVAVLIIGGVIVWMTQGARQSDTSTTTGTTTPATTNTDQLETSTTNNEVVTVTMKNSQFSPKKITIKPGTTVKWVNEDTVRHNVVAANEGDTSGLPSNNELFGKGGTYEFTFETVGTFDYKCTPHPFMTGTVEVAQ